MSDEDKLTIVGADWCGWTQKQVKEVASSKHAHMFEYIDCAGKDKDHELCKNVQGFPVIKNKDGHQCNVGFMDPKTDEFHEMMLKCQKGEK